MRDKDRQVRQVARSIEMQRKRKFSLTSRRWQAETFRRVENVTDNRSSIDNRYIGRR